MVPKILGSIVLATCAAVAIVILLVVYVRRKLLRRSRPLPLAPASESKATIEPPSSDEPQGEKSCEPSGLNTATSERAAPRVTIYDIILKATDNFSDERIIGHGDFGTVYDATLADGRRAAIKKLHGSYHFLCPRQFGSEMETTIKVKHQNLVPLLGYWALGNERLLIYEHMRHGSLETWLRNQANNTPDNEAIGWPERLKICLGSARGLMFLHQDHHGFVTHTIHRDIKSSNILLDEHMCPRVSDFCLARIISGYETYVRTGASGSLGYIPPEYPLRTKCTAKGDVYSFGVVMLEVITGRPPVGQEVEEGGGNLVGWVRWMVAHGREGELFDPWLPVSGLCREQMARVLAVAQECTADEPWKRPTMGSVVEDLEMIQLIKDEPHGLQLQGRAEY